MNVRGFLMKTIKKDIDGKRVEIKVYKSNRTRTEGDIEMDKRAKSAVKAARSWIIIPEIENESANIIIDYLSSEERNGKEV